MWGTQDRALRHDSFYRLGPGLDRGQWSSSKAGSRRLLGGVHESEGAVWRAGCAQKANRVLEKQRYRAVTGWWGVWENGSSVLRARSTMG